MLKIIKSSIFIVMLLIIIEAYETIDYKVHNYVIDNIYLNDNVYNKAEYIGYIEIERLNIKREIVLDINDKNLMTHVALSSKSKSLESDNIILAGHAIKNIFGNLKNIEKGDIINITSLEHTRYYKVESIDIVSKYNIDVIDNSHLILITCVDFNKRLIVKAKRI